MPILAAERSFVNIVKSNTVEKSDLKRFRLIICHTISETALYNKKLINYDY